MRKYHVSLILSCSLAHSSSHRYLVYWRNSDNEIERDKEIEKEGRRKKVGERVREGGRRDGDGRNQIRKKKESKNNSKKGSIKMQMSNDSGEGSQSLRINMQNIHLWNRYSNSKIVSQPWLALYFLHLQNDIVGSVSLQGLSLAKEKTQSNEESSHPFPSGILLPNHCFLQNTFLFHQRFPFFWFHGVGEQSGQQR